MVGKNEDKASQEGTGKDKYRTLVIEKQGCRGYFGEPERPGLKPQLCQSCVTSESNVSLCLGFSLFTTGLAGIPSARPMQTSARIQHPVTVTALENKTSALKEQKSHNVAQGLAIRKSSMTDCWLNRQTDRGTSESKPLSAEGLYLPFSSHSASWSQRSCTVEWGRPECFQEPL